MNLIKEGAKKAALVHLLKYSATLKIKSVFVEVRKNGEVRPAVDLTEQITLYSLIGAKLLRSLPKAWSEKALINAVLSERKTEQGSRMASLMAYLLSRDKEYELERFNFQWIALNGMYSWYLPKTGKVSERDQMSALARQGKLGEEVLEKTRRDALGSEILRLIMQDRETETAAVSIVQNKPCELSENIRRTIREAGARTNVYGFLLLDFAYYLRCNTFHASKPIPLIAYKYDKEIKALALVNTILQDFLDRNLPGLF